MFSAVFALGIVGVPARAQTEIAVKAPQALLMDAESGAVLFSAAATR